VDRFTASFLGEANFITGNAEATGLRLIDGSVLPWASGKTAPGTPQTLAIRPESISLTANWPDGPKSNCTLKGQLRQIVFSGPTATCLVEALGVTFKVLVKAPELSALPSSGEVWMSWPYRAGIAVAED
jgi:putative spermidine/putrescine transport system ATP-binding protein